jgi:hypothetical protein
MFCRVDDTLDWTNELDTDHRNFCGPISYQSRKDVRLEQHRT